jgi:hypothetical protein
LEYLGGALSVVLDQLCHSTLHADKPVLNQIEGVKMA